MAGPFRSLLAGFNRSLTLSGGGRWLPKPLPFRGPDLTCASLKLSKPGIQRKGAKVQRRKEAGGEKALRQAAGERENDE